MQKLKNTALVLLLLSGLVINRVAAQTPGLKTRVEGKGQPMIMIPGLTCSGDVWNETVAKLGEGYEYHIITLPGFAGNPPIANHEDKYLEKMTDLLLDYVHSKGLNKPVIMGHSLGGFLALKMALKEPNLPAKLVIVDSLPFLPGIQMPGATVESATALAKTIKTQMMAAANQSVEQRMAYQRMILKTMILDSAKIELAAKWGAISDMKTSAQAMYELYSTDIRADIKKIKVPTLVLGAYIAFKQYGATRKNTLKGYKDQYAEMPNVTVDLTDHGNHFIMWDDPEFFHQWLDKFL